MACIDLLVIDVSIIIEISRPTWRCAATSRTRPEPPHRVQSAVHRHHQWVYTEKTGIKVIGWKAGRFFFCFYSPCSSSNKQLRALAWGSMPNLPFSFSWPLVRNNVVLDPAKCHLNPSNGESMIINDRQTTDRPHYAKMCNNNPWRCKKPYLMVWFKVKL